MQRAERSSTQVRTGRKCFVSQGGSKWQPTTQHETKEPKKSIHLGLIMIIHNQQIKKSMFQSVKQLKTETKRTKKRWVKEVKNQSIKPKCSKEITNHNAHRTRWTKQYRNTLTTCCNGKEGLFKQCSCLKKEKKLSKYFYSTAWVYFYFMCIIQTSETEGNRIFWMLKVRSKSNYLYTERDECFLYMKASDVLWTLDDQKKMSCQNCRPKHRKQKDTHKKMILNVCS